MKSDEVLELSGCYVLNILECRVGNERDEISRAMHSQRLLGEKKVHLRGYAKVAAPVAHIDLPGIGLDDGAFAHARAGRAGGSREWCVQTEVEAASSVFYTKSISDDVEVIETVIGQYTTDKAIDSIAHHGNGNHVGRTPINKGWETRVDLHSI